MAPVYEFECANEHPSEAFFSVEDKPFAIRCPKCRGEAVQVIRSAPAIATIASFARDIKDPFVQKHASKDGYYDPNLGRDKKTGKRTKITSPRHREELMKQAGLEPYGETDVTRDADSLKRRKPIHFNAGGSRKSAEL